MTNAESPSASDSLPDPLAGFPVIVSLPVEWGDQDAFGHVSHAVYFKWLESGRIAYFDCIGRPRSNDGRGTGMILAAVECSYLQPLKYPDTVRVATRTERMGRSSLVYVHRIWSQAHSTLVAEGRSTIVAFDYSANKSQPLNDALRLAVEKIEARSFAD